MIVVGWNWRRFAASAAVGLWAWTMTAENAPAAAPPPTGKPAVTAKPAAVPAKKTPPPVKPAPPLQLILQKSRRDGVVSGIALSGQEYRVELIGRNLTSPSRIAWTLVDENSHLTERGEVTLAPGKRLHAFNFKLRRNGVYRLTAATADGKVKVESVFAVFPGDSFNDVDELLGAGGIDNLKELSQRCGLRWRRRVYGVGDTRYPQAFRKDKLDEEAQRRAAELEKQQQLHPLGVLFMPLRGEQYDDRKFAVWKDRWLTHYVIPLVTATKGNIRYWEVFSEAPNYFGGAPDKYFELLRDTANAIRKIDPGLKIVGVSGPHDLSGTRFYEEVFKLGALDYMDVLSVRMTLNANRVAAAPELRLADWYAVLRNLLRDFGQPQMPIWNTETSLNPPATMFALPVDLSRINYHGLTAPPVREQAAVMGRVLTEQYAAKVKYFFQNFAPSGYYGGNAAEFDGTPTAVTVVMAAVPRLLSGSEYVGRADGLGPVYLHFFRRNQHEAVIVGWLMPPFRADDAVTLALPPELQGNRVFDLFGNPAGVDVAALKITPEPVFIKIDTGKSSDAEIMQLLRGCKPDRGLSGRPDPALVVGLQPLGPDGWKGFAPVDLRLAANANFTDEVANDREGGFIDDGTNDLRLLPSGDYRVNGVPFRIIDPAANDRHACLVLRGNWRFQFPPGVKGVALNGKLQNLHLLLLCNASSRAKSGDPVLTVTVNYRDGKSEKMIVRYQQDIFDCSDLRKPEHSAIGLRLPNPCRDAVTVIHKTLKPSRPETVSSLDFYGGGDTGVLTVVLAVTGEAAR